MASKIFEVKVVSVDRESGFAKLIDSSEIDDVVPYELFIPAYFGGHTNPWPKVDETLLIRYSNSITRTGHTRIIDAWRPSESAQEYEAPAASLL